MPKHNLLEKAFEYLLWKSRIGTIFIVVFCAIGAISLFIMGSREIFTGISLIFTLEYHPKSTEQILIYIIGAIDLYLIGIILLLFSFGIYELFISDIDHARAEGGANILNIESLDELKNKILKVIIMVMIVTLAKVILEAKFSNPLEILYFAFSILCVSGAVFLIRMQDRNSDA